MNCKACKHCVIMQNADGSTYYHCLHFNDNIDTMESPRDNPGCRFFDRKKKKSFTLMNPRVALNKLKEEMREQRERRVA